MRRRSGRRRKPYPRRRREGLGEGGSRRRFNATPTLTLPRQRGEGTLRSNRMPHLAQLGDDLLRQRLGRGADRLQHDLRVLRRLIGAVDAGEVLDRARLAPWRRAPSGRAAMQSSIGVSTKTSMNSPGSTRSRTIRRSARKGEMKRAEHDHAGIDEELRHLADAADVLHPVGVGEAEVACSARGGHCRRRACMVQAAGLVQRLLDELAMVDLPRAGEAGEPQDRPASGAAAPRALPCRPGSPRGGCWSRGAARRRPCPRRRSGW